MHNQSIAELSDVEIADVNGGIIPQVFFWLGVVQTGEWVIEKAYEAGKWVGQNS